MHKSMPHRAAQCLPVALALLPVICPGCRSDMDSSRENRPPTLQFVSPVNAGGGVTVDQGELIEFVVQLWDPNGLEDLVDLTWTSSAGLPLDPPDLDSMILDDGNGFVSWATTDLSPEYHLITASLLDQDEALAEAWVVVDVREVPDFNVSTWGTLDGPEMGLSLVHPADGERGEEDTAFEFVLEAWCDGRARDEMELSFSLGNGDAVCDLAWMDLVYDTGADSDLPTDTGDGSLWLATCSAELPVGVHKLTAELRDPAGFVAGLAFDFLVEDNSLVDHDGDGFTVDDGDCDDDDASVYPTAAELCDGVDNNCDGTIDEPDSLDAQTWFQDDDGDSYGDASASVVACDVPIGYVPDDCDCDDADPTQHPGSDEYCNGEDDDCDGETDEDDAVDVLTWYRDGDGDTYGDAATSDTDCDAISGYVADSTDCDDSDSTQYPGADEQCNGEDDDCDGEADEDEAVDVITWYVDSDSDGYGDAGTTQTGCEQPTGHVADDTDCDDTDAAQHPGAEEHCDGEDDDCDGDVDEDDAVDVLTWYRDADGDKYGDAAVSDVDCDQPVGYVDDETDCDDGDDTQHPAATEYCNGEDDDCDGVVDEDDAADVLTWYRDADGDKYGDAAVSDIGCDQPVGYVGDETDCDDGDDAQHPGATEYCNGEDDNCDGTIDEDSAADVLTWYRDADSDSHGSASASDIDCDQPAGYVLDYADCDDTDSTQHPGAEEHCNGEDDDCDGETDEDDAVDVLTWYRDGDEDTYGDAATSDTDCDAISGYVADSTDCDDSDSTQYPGADERCNGEDDDCDGETDEDDALDVTTWYADIDGDSFGDASNSDTDCEAISGYVADNTDCDDADSTQNPGADERCNGEDDDCDGEKDEDEAVDVLTWYADSDSDGYGDAGTTQTGCDQPTGHVADDTDCDDTDAAQHPGAEEHCDGEDDDCDGDVDEDDAVDVLTWYRDADGDKYGDAAVSDVDCDQPVGYVDDETDCDDWDDAQHPAAVEYCNGEDDDCDGDVDEDDAADVITWYRDADGDKYGEAAVSDIGCEQPVGYVGDETDCDDGDDAQHPGATEYCNGEDDNCDGTIDEDSAADVNTWYRDADSDSYGSASVSEIDCDQPAGYVLDHTDCDDTDSAQHPGAEEYCNDEDDDCDGIADEDSAIDAATWYRDADSDNYGSSTATSVACDQPSGFVTDSSDCDDTDGAQYPGATEHCDGQDNDCDGAVDEDDAADVLTWYRDADADSYGDPSNSDIDCDQPTGYVEDDSDCDDSSSATHPGATEYCDGVDDNCDGTVDEDEAVDVLTWYRDADADSHGNPSSTDIDCDQPSGYVADDTDCDDTDGAQFPGAAEHCNGEDDDCDGSVDEGDAVDASTWYMDMDGDGFGSSSYSLTLVECEQPSTSWSDSDADCNDADPSAYPGATEYCDGIDNDCNGDVDEDDAVDAATWYRDYDGDGYGVPGSTTAACEQPSGYVGAGDDDCNDLSAEVNPGASEVCDYVDNDCDGSVDESSAVDASTWYRDADDDGFGDAADTLVQCSQPSGYGIDSADCDDSDDETYPGADELCDGSDNDCDGDVDEADAVDAPTWYLDYDMDGYGGSTYISVSCSQPVGYAAGSADCNDLDATVNPGVSETCDSIDNDCDGTVDEADALDAHTWYLDYDRDGYGTPSSTTTACLQPSGYASAGTSDCDDFAWGVNPGATELCDYIDNDCDSAVDEPDAADATTWYHDDDGDGFGDAGDAITQCLQPIDHVTDATDCDDDDASVNPGADELCDGVDNDCAGDIDEIDAVDVVTWWLDYDGDGYGGTTYSSISCAQPSGYYEDNDDCNDMDPAVNPSASEWCDTVDNDCDGTIDEDDALDAATWYEDTDGDSYGDASSTTPACFQPSGYVADDTDCYDNNSSAYPGSSAYHTSNRGDGSFDYNCSGSNDNQYGSYSPCGHTSCSDSDGWSHDHHGSSGIPGCGVTGTWTRGCCGVGFICVECDQISLTQACR
jgi:large repetitive protein